MVFRPEIDARSREKCSIRLEVQSVLVRRDAHGTVHTVSMTSEHSYEKNAQMVEQRSISIYQTRGIGMSSDGFMLLR